ncbi:phytoene dehydrogenase-like oxidoreductase [Desulfocapsa sulfexigens DSM 10523]|uniref:Phytoene dehydrogenase-like oxidoreductase n=1 Tax=Desulfocapsa sulfexigens (strain DSM 10523 / SB164P1) TaxID=1167006 RepID=M1NIZ6_DESSD|nr:NAD(P)/FAD-dependent oxidoreductase [Desulfocapsa sulfexigens]AGF79504.1 phytoene dehydrogenase-like oxidoreductase [Desulfocapsa sulfexigens DSM 10523]
MHVPLLIIGGGLSGLAAAVRFSRFIPDVLLLEQHSRVGGLNSYYYRNNRLFETGLHAITNYAAPKEKNAPLNRLLRQLKIKRNELELHQQNQSEIRFSGQESLLFSNDFSLLETEIAEKFPASYDGFQRLLQLIDEYDPFKPLPFISAKQVLQQHLHNSLLTDMLLCPLMYYGSSIENDMDLGQFVIMFRAIFLEGMFRPGGTIKDLLDLLLSHYKKNGGEIRTRAKVSKILQNNRKVHGVLLDDGEEISCDYLLSTVGSEETFSLLGKSSGIQSMPRLGFVETIFEIDPSTNLPLAHNRTIIFFNNEERFSYQQPDQLVDYKSGVICMPQNFENLPFSTFREVRTTHLARYEDWKELEKETTSYKKAKDVTALTSLSVAEKILGNFGSDIVYRDTFTPLTIERFTAKIKGAIYGNPIKIKDGDIGYDNLYLAGTDQGFLGIIGSMLSGVSIVNQHILPRL